MLRLQHLRSSSAAPTPFIIAASSAASASSALLPRSSYSSTASHPAASASYSTFTSSFSAIASRPASSSRLVHIIRSLTRTSFSLVHQRSFHSTTILRAEEDDDDHKAQQQDADDATNARDQKSVAKELGLTGHLSKAERLQLASKRKRAQKLITAEQQRGKQKAEKAKSQQMKRANALKQQAAQNIGVEGDQERPELLVDDALDDVELDKSQQKQLNAELAKVLPKVDANTRRSPAQIAAAAALAAKAKADLLREQSVIRVNEKITAQQIILIHNDKNLGTFTLRDALKRARAEGLDLFQVSPYQATNPKATCKLLNYKLYKMQQERNERDMARAKRLLNRELKTIQLKPKIAIGDFNTKMERIKKFLGKGHPVKLTYYTHGGQPHDPLIFIPLFEKAVEQLYLDGSVEPNSISSSKTWLNFAPITEKKRQTMYPRLTEEQKKMYQIYCDEMGVWKQKGRVEVKEENEDEEDENEEDEDEEDEEDDEDELSATPTPASQPSIPTPPPQPAVVTPAAATPIKSAAPTISSSTPSSDSSSNNKNNKKQHQKKPPAYASGPVLFSRAALQNMKKEQGGTSAGK